MRDITPSKLSHGIYNDNFNVKNTRVSYKSACYVTGNCSIEVFFSNHLQINLNQFIKDFSAATIFYANNSILPISPDLNISPIFCSANAMNFNANMTEKDDLEALGWTMLYRLKGI